MKEKLFTSKRKSSFFSIVFFFIIFIINNSSIFSYSLVMKKQVKVANAEVCFHDIFLVKGKMEFIDTSVLDKVCFFNTSHEIQKIIYDDVELKLIEENIIPDKVYKKQTKIIPVLKKISKKEILNQINNILDIDSNYSIQSQIKILSNIEEIQIPKNAKIKYYIRDKKYPGNKKLVIQVLSFRNENKIIENIQIPFQLVYEVKVYYTKIKLNRKDKLKFSKVGSKIILVTSRLEYRKLRVRSLLQKQNLASGFLEAKKTIKKNKVLYKEDFYHKSIVKRGKIINVVYSKGGLHINIEAKAKQKGNIGDIISVVNVMNSRKKFRAKIISSNKAIFIGVGQ